MCVYVCVCVRDVRMYAPVHTLARLTLSFMPHDVRFGFGSRRVYVSISRVERCIATEAKAARKRFLQNFSKINGGERHLRDYD